MNTLSQLQIITARTSKPRTIKRNAKTQSKSLRRLPDNVSNYLVKAERVNGRSAMIGFTAAVAEEAITGNSISTQFMDNIGISVAVTALVILGTAANPKDEGLLWGVFNREAETVNGRLAMIGIISLLLNESLHPQIPLF